MSEQRRGLGRGLGSLIPTVATSSDRAGARDDAPAGAVDGAFFAEIPVTAITPNARQPRAVFDEDLLAELVASIQQVGLLQPIIVRRTGDEHYELVMGERRWRAVQQLGWPAVPAIVKETSDDEMLRRALLENVHRAQLNPLEEAAAYQQLLDDFGGTHDELAAKLGRSRPHITNTLRLLRLTPPVQRRVAAGVLSAGHARALVAVTDADQQEALAARVVAEGVSVRGLEELIVLGPGGSARRTPVARVSGPTAEVAERLEEVARRLGERLDTRCRVDLGRRRGKVTIDFASVADLDRITALLLGDAAD